MAKRLISAGVGIVIGVSILIFDNLFVYCAAICFFSAVAVWELTRAIKCEKLTVLRWSSIVMGAVYPAVMIIDWANFLILPVSMGYVLLMALVMLKCHKEVRFEQVLACGAAGGLLPVALSSIILLRYSECGKDLGIFMLLYLLFCAWFGDSGAYFAGTFFGKHKLCPEISPKKTVEGLIGGIVTTSVIFVVFNAIYINLISKEGLHANYILLALAGAVCALIGTLGDLSASMIKRQCGIKDYGNIMPGHGGMMDRFDSVLFVMPTFYAFLSVMDIYK